MGPYLAMEGAKEDEEDKKAVIRQWQNNIPEDEWLEKSNDAQTTVPVLIGDQCMLNQANATTNAGFLSAEGVVGMRVGLQLPHSNQGKNLVRDCQFRICPPLGYEAARMLAKLKAKKDVDPDELLQMIQQMENEKQRNEYLLQRFSQGDGQNNNLLYGQVVQLQHVTSGAFVVAMQGTALNQKVNGRCAW